MGIWLLVVVALLGVAVGAAGVGAFLHSERVQRAPLSAPAVAVDADVSGVLAALSVTTVLLGPEREVLRASPDAYATGLVRTGQVLADPVADLVAEVRRTGTNQRSMLTLPRSSVPGAEVTELDVTAAPLSADRVLVLAEDTTVSRRLEAVRRDFVANVSHELKTPVGALSLLAETIEAAADEPDTVRRFSEQMRSEAARLSLLVADIIDLSRLEAPETETLLVDLSVDAVVSEAVDLVALTARARGARISVGGTTGLRVFGDHALLVTALRNLLDNALRYSHDGAQVSVATRARDGVVEIAVIDQGIGISQADARRVFERFYRVDPARARDTGGTGLGLSIVKHVVSRHGGDVRVWSVPGRGSTFTLRIPEAEHGSEPDRGEEVA